MLSGVYDSDVEYLLSRMLKPGDLCIDVGANVGALSLSMAKKVLPGGVVFAFEPGEKNYKRLCSNLMLNTELNQITRAVRAGVSNKKGVLYWNEDPKNVGNAHLLSEQGESISVDTLDHFALQYAIDHVDFIKIDVEGMELEVLQGSIQLISKYKPLIVFETNTVFESLRGISLREKIFTLLSSVDYAFIRWSGQNFVQVKDLNQSASDCLAIPNCKVSHYLKVLSEKERPLNINGINQL